MQSVAIVLLCIASAVVYGILHDQGTVRVCLEYFTVGHPFIFPTRSPTFLADLWAHSASYLVGFLGGTLVIIAVWRSRKEV
jgi:hypothetical protein